MPQNNSVYLIYYILTVTHWSDLNKAYHKLIVSWSKVKDQPVHKLVILCVFFLRMCVCVCVCFYFEKQFSNKIATIWHHIKSMIWKRLNEMLSCIFSYFHSPHFFTLPYKILSSLHPFFSFNYVCSECFCSQYPPPASYCFFIFFSSMRVALNCQQLYLSTLICFLFYWNFFFFYGPTPTKHLHAMSPPHNLLNTSMNCLVTQAAC